MSVNAVSSSTPVQQDRGLSSLKSEDFFKILVTELQNQDPFKPSDSSQMIASVSQIRTIEQSDQLTRTLAQLAQTQRVGGSNELIGKYVQAVAVDGSGNELLFEGVVTSVYYNSQGQAILELDTGDVVEAGYLVRVTTPEQIESERAEAA